VQRAGDVGDGDTGVSVVGAGVPGAGVVLGARVVGAGVVLLLIKVMIEQEDKDKTDKLIYSKDKDPVVEL
jgi:threonine dehydrogenase-like Zn-dependent dehydrogenase